MPIIRAEIKIKIIQNLFIEKYFKKTNCCQINGPLSHYLSPPKLVTY